MARAFTTSKKRTQMAERHRTHLASFLSIVATGTLVQIGPYRWYLLPIYYFAAATVFSYVLGVPWWKIPPNTDGQERKTD